MMTITTEAITVEEFCWRPGARIYHTDATEFGTWLKDQGAVKAEQLVKLCEPEDVPGHDHIYHHTDAEAIQLHREGQARMLLNSLRPAIEIMGGGFVDIPAFPSVPESLLSDEERVKFDGTHSREVYVPWSRVTSDEVILDYLAEEAKQAAIGWSNRYKAYRATKPFEAVLPIFEAIDRVQGE